jgi:hypothetical protein
MNAASLVVPGEEQSPSLHVYVNPLYSLYHYLVKEAELPASKRNPATAAAAVLMGRARNQRGVNGIWTIWEQPIAAGGTREEVVQGLGDAMAATVARIGEALGAAEDVFLNPLWPERLPLVEAALATLRADFAPHFSAMARRQGELLGLAWPRRIDAFLVADCYAWQGGYSHPLTLDVSQLKGLELCETLLHEATHVADLYTGGLGRQSLEDRLRARLVEHGIGSTTAWNVWHAVIFAASAQQIRAFINPEHIDYALPRKVYTWLKTPDLPALWEEFSTGAIDEAAFLDAIAKLVDQA